MPDPETGKLDLDALAAFVGAHDRVAGPVGDQDLDCERLVFDPIPLCDGIEPSDDPVLRARPRAYALSSARRMQSVTTAQ